MGFAGLRRASPGFAGLSWALALGTLLGGCCHRPTFSSHSVGNGQVTTLTYDATRRAIKVLYLSTEDPVIQKQIQSCAKELAQLIRIEKPCPIQRDRIRELRDYIAVVNAATTRPVILAEPPPDAMSVLAAEITSSSDNPFKGKVYFSESAIKLAQLSAVNHAIRDALYRLNEAAIMQPAILTNGTFTNIFAVIMHTAASMSTNLHFTPEAAGTTNAVPESKDSKTK